MACMPASRVSCQLSIVSAANAVHGGVLRRLRRLDLPGLGQRELLAPAFTGGLDQALVLEQLQRRVDGAGARAPRTTGALVELLDHLVAVHRPLGEQREQGGTDVGAPTAATTATAATLAGAAEAEATTAEAGTEARAGAAEAAVHPRLVGSGSEVFSAESHLKDLQSVGDASTIYRQCIADKS